MTAEFHEYARRNDREVAELSTKIDVHVGEERIRDEDMAKQIAELNEKVGQLLDMWSQAKGAVTFMKVMAAIVAGGAAAWAWISANIAIAPK